MNPRLLTPSMSLLLAFEAAARHESFTRAAEELSLTQSAVSRHVQMLELTLGVALFKREKRRIILTEIGAMYLREIGSGLQRIRNASLQAIAYRTGGGALHLAVLPTFGTKWLLPRMKGFYAQHPGIQVHIHSRIGQFDLELAGIDAAISVGDGNWPGLEAYRLVEESVLPVIASASAQALPIASAKDLARHPLLQVSGRPAVWRQWFQANDLPHNMMKLGPQFELTSHVIQAVAAGIGIGLLPSFLVEDEIKNGVLARAIDAPLDTGQSYWLLLPPNKLKHPPVAAFKEWLLQEWDV